jgi:hypothetical protein
MKLALSFLFSALALTALLCFLESGQALFAAISGLFIVGGLTLNEDVNDGVHRRRERAAKKFAGIERRLRMHDELK